MYAQNQTSQDSGAHKDDLVERRQRYIDRQIALDKGAVNLVSQIEMPPRAGTIVEYDWYLGGSDYTFEPATKLATPQVRVNATRTVSFPKPGEYVITLRTVAERDGAGGAESTTPLINIHRVRVVVR
jgi:hypothetical protein